MRFVPIADVAEINPHTISVAADTPVSFVGMAELDATAATTISSATRKFGEVSKGYTVFRDRDVLAAKITPCWENGKIGQARLEHLIGVGSTEFHVLRSGQNLDERYLLHYLRQVRIRKAGELRMTGSGGQKRVPAAFLQALEIPLPNVPEQRRIAAILDHADALRAKRRQVFAHLDSLTQSIFMQTFGEIRASSTVEAEAGLIRTGPFGSQLLHSEFVDEGVAVLGLDNVVGNNFRWVGRRFITPAKYQHLKRYTVSPGDVLISIMGTTGRCVVVPDNIPTAINTKHICAITPEPTRVDSMFLRAAFLWHPASLDHLRRQTKGSVMDGLNMNIIKAMPIPLPPLDSQRDFAEKAAMVAQQETQTLRAATHEDALFASLQSRAFRGEL